MLVLGGEEIVLLENFIGVVVIGYVRQSTRFRDFETFNQAVLAKQGWRLLQNPRSLTQEVLRAKYFPEETF